MSKGNEKRWPQDKPSSFQKVDFRYDGRWYPGEYDDSDDWPHPIWKAENIVYPKTYGIACSIAPRWKPRSQPN